MASKGLQKIQALVMTMEAKRKVNMKARKQMIPLTNAPRKGMKLKRQVKGDRMRTRPRYINREPPIRRAQVILSLLDFYYMNICSLVQVDSLSHAISVGIWHSLSAQLHKAQQQQQPLLLADNCYSSFRSSFSSFPLWLIKAWFSSFQTDWGSFDNGFSQNLITL